MMKLLNEMYTLGIVAVNGMYTLVVVVIVEVLNATYTPVAVV